ncbi:MAG TPA: bacitracin ABC transporter ATP-binding protein [Ornithinibacillus sp.]|uniref:Bacitracin export ATP-binding protein BceA n=2 Tax=Ornithinibacillus bavariensis TaxID=545502 RepID=A0A920C889_9BACI|nr:ABC transporter ATP-binding protein [Ornithinibacillus bavariensis]GIO27954.1 bacitracin export ATP-binding protein BceA [Ornithinibacillus bavariensis]HAM81096.1 bacitracin ABC transporter ATP-binding protein [Ornithinibacillus sp.]
MNDLNVNETVLLARNVHKTYGSRSSSQHVLKGIDLHVTRKEFVGIMGPSGSGKTTLLNVLATIDRCTDGAILVENVDISSLKDSALSAFRRKNLGFIFQDYNLLDTLTIKENILLPISLHKMSKHQAEKEFTEIAEVLGIKELADKYPHEVSGGQKQRTAAGRALIHLPSIVFADEPTGALDSKSASSLLDTMEKINQQRNVTIIMVTHDPVASSYCNRVVFLKDGRLYSELYRGDKSRHAFFKEILDVQAVLGGDNVDSR